MDRATILTGRRALLYAAPSFARDLDSVYISRSVFVPRGLGATTEEPTFLQSHVLLTCERAMATKDIRYRGRKFIARQYANGWQIEIVPLRPGQVRQ